MKCINPECENTKILARGYCAGCYHRLKRTGSIARTYVVNSGKCSVNACGKAAFAKNLCVRHYNENRHPLKVTWALLRSRAEGDYPPSWDRFEAFLADVGERPSPKHQLRRKDPETPWSTTNMRWVDPIRQGQDYYTAEQRSEYARLWNLKKKFKMTGAQYEALLASQGGGCAICKSPESHVDKDGKKSRLAVDHDHQTGEIRGLLCVRHNRGIGWFQDDIAMLREAADYLERHNAKPRLVCDSGEAA